MINVLTVHLLKTKKVFIGDLDKLIVYIFVYC